MFSDGHLAIQEDSVVQQQRFRLGDVTELLTTSFVR